jgi:hypothetical protein
MLFYSAVLLTLHYEKAYKSIKTILIAKQRKLIAQHYKKAYKSINTRA